MGRSRSKSADSSKSKSFGALTNLVREVGLSLEGYEPPMTSTAADPYKPAAASTADAHRQAIVEQVAPLVASSPSCNDDDCPVSPGGIFEAMLFVGAGQPLAADQVAASMRGVRPAEIDQMAVELNARYAAERCPYRIVSENAGYRLVLTDEFARLRNSLAGKQRAAKLSVAAVETLAAIAHHESLTVDEVSAIRGTDAKGALHQLVRRDLLTTRRVGKEPVRYFVTEKFLQLFGLSSLADFPRGEDLTN